MTGRRGSIRKLSGWLLAASALSSGCLSFCHSTGQPPPEQKSACNTLPRYCRNHVYVFFIQGIDPLCVSNLSGVRDYVQSLGFIKTYYGQLYHAGTIAKEIRRLHGEDENAHFVLIGYNLGANGVRDVAKAVQRDGISVDLIVYMGGIALEDVPEMKTANVGRVVNIRTKDWLGNGPVLEDAVNLTCTDVSFFGDADVPLDVGDTGSRIAKRGRTGAGRRNAGAAARRAGTDPENDRRERSGGRMGFSETALSLRRSARPGTAAGQSRTEGSGASTDFDRPALMHHSAAPLAPVLRGEGSGVRGARQNTAPRLAPHPRPLSPEYRGEGSTMPLSPEYRGEGSSMPLSPEFRGEGKRAVLSVRSAGAADAIDRTSPYLRPPHSMPV